MNYVVKNEELDLQYIPGKGAWTYHSYLRSLVTIPEIFIQSIPHRKFPHWECGK